MTVSVQITDSTKVKFGFQMTARLTSDAANGQAGDFTTGADGFTQVLCDDGSSKSNGKLCSSQFPVQFIEHTLQGYESSTKGGYTYTFTWTPPAASTGNVILYAAGNAGPGDPPQPTPTNVYTTSVTLTPGSTSGWALIIDLQWRGPDFQHLHIDRTGFVDFDLGSQLSPVARRLNGTAISIDQLGGVSVTIDGKQGYIWFVNATQINVQVPDDNNTGTVNVVGDDCRWERDLNCHPVAV